MVLYDTDSNAIQAVPPIKHSKKEELVRGYRRVPASSMREYPNIKLGWADALSAHRLF
jgi:hypothetical protein